ncbi:ribosomal protein S5 domain 2-type protein [Pilobolus umbonatus]|nr:ribosomal protein S5 domain 2-type protein [Pilobolus umbonatus]
MVSITTVASAPGKVLITGGYLVLEQAFTGLVVGTSARFYTVIRSQTFDNAGTITVTSPQFDKATWKYKAHVDSQGQLEFSTTTVDSQNKFVETCLKFTFMIMTVKIGKEVFNQELAKGLHITIVGDNDFYSQRAQLEAKHLSNSAHDLASLDPFCRTFATLSTVHKTGLGSSAALITSLVASLLLHFRVVNRSLEKNDRLFIHNVAQYIHCYAQGKVGSGFDVSSAVWGSHRYKRFNPDILTPIMMTAASLVDVLDPSIPRVQSIWDNEVSPFQLPPKFELMLADIDAGSHTPTLVGKVLAWKKANKERAHALWNELGAYNNKVEHHLRTLHSFSQKDSILYNKTVDQCATLPSTEWNKLKNTEEFVSLVDSFNHVRLLLRRMSELSNVPIEPVEQTRLLDACTKIPGVVMAGVPGAGGYDAIFCLVVSEKAKEEVYHVWEHWKELNVGPLLAHSDSNGVTIEELNCVPGLSSV